MTAPSRKTTHAQGRPKAIHNGSIATRKAARAIISPVRQELIDCIESVGPCTIAHAAHHLGRAPDSLYFHIKALVRAGLLVKVPPSDATRSQAAIFPRKSVREPAIYDVCTRPMTLAYRKPILPQDLTAIASGMLRLAQRDIKSVLTSTKSNPAVRMEGPERQLWFARAKGWLSPSELKKLNQLLTQALELVRATKPVAGAKPLSLVFALAPSAPTKRSGHYL